MSENNIKESLYHKLTEDINNKIKALEQDIQSLDESQNNETKSSAGDKYETGRAMIQQEQDKNQSQLSNALALKHTLEKLNLTKEYNKVEPGAIVLTNQGDYFLSIGSGKIDLNGALYYAISQGSPIGQLLLNKKAGDTINYMNKPFEIRMIY
jgi:transcription elongation GreA/GreB family factor